MHLISFADPNCPICRGRGFELRDDPDSIVAMPSHWCECVVRAARHEQTRKRLAAANIPDGFAGAHIDRFNLRTGSVNVLDEDRAGASGAPITRSIAERETDELNREKVRALAQEPLPAGATLIFTGPPGAGKTYLAAALLIDQIVRHGASGLMTNAEDYISALRPDALEPRVQQALKRHVRKVGVLLIDDLGVEKESEFSARELFAVIDERYANRLPTIITSNNKMSDLFNRKEADVSKMTAPQREVWLFGKRIFSRLSQDRFVIEWPEGTSDYRAVAYRQQRASDVVRSRMHEAHGADVADPEAGL